MQSAKYCKLKFRYYYIAGPLQGFDVAEAYIEGYKARNQGMAQQDNIVRMLPNDMIHDGDLIGFKPSLITHYDLAGCVKKEDYGFYVVRKLKL